MERIQEDLSRNVHVTAQLTARWGGVDYDLSKGAKVQYGVVHHWQGVYPEVPFTVEDVQEKLTSRDVKDPLETVNRGKAFAGLQKGRKREGE